MRDAVLSRRPRDHDPRPGMERSHPRASVHPGVHDHVTALVGSGDGDTAPGEQREWCGVRVAVVVAFAH